MNRIATILSLMVFAGLIAVPSAHGQQVFGEQTQVELSNDLRGEIVDSVCMAIGRVYVFPEVAQQMEDLLRGKLKSGAYNTVETISDYARVLTEDLRSISKDRHLTILYLSPEEIAQMPEGEPTEEDLQRIQEEEVRRMARNNFGFQKLEILSGNVGIVRLNGFEPAEFGGRTAIAALNFLSNCDAIVFDLRGNGGGSPSMIQLISSYLFEEPTHLNSFYIRQNDTTQQFWTQAWVDGPRLTEVPAYVLTSGYTFSAAEEFTYNLKNLERATIVGETTGGGAHPVERHVFPNINVRMSLPFGRAINPITGINWEGTGVSPHIEVAADLALIAAHEHALKTIRESETDEGALYALDWALVDLQAKLKPVTVDTELLARYAGSYEDRRISLDAGKLMYQRGDRPAMAMIPLSESLFGFEELDWFRIEVVTDMSNQPLKVIGHYDNGTTDESQRTSDS